MSISKTLKSITVDNTVKVAVGTFAGVAALIFGIRYLGDKPFFNDLAKGIRGDTTKFNWFGFIR